MAVEMDELVSGQEFSAAANCAALLVEWVRDTAAGRPPAERIALLTESGQAIEMARRKICVARARMADRLLRLERSAEYCDLHSAGVHTWAVEG